MASKTGRPSEGYMELTVQNVYGLLLRSKLMSTWTKPRRCTPAGRPRPKTRPPTWPGSPPGWCSIKYVTEYQATLLARGHADGFFLNEYKILDRLGKGRMAGVYKAQHHLGQIVAIKVLPPSKAKDANLLGRFQREARLAAQLKHPNIVRDVQMGQANGLHYLVMEYLEGETLEDVHGAAAKIPARRSGAAGLSGAAGFAAHPEQDLVHRDLKPANLMLVGRNAWDTTLARR